MFARQSAFSARSRGDDSELWRGPTSVRLPLAISCAWGSVRSRISGEPVFALGPERDLPPPYLDCPEWVSYGAAAVRKEVQWWLERHCF